jgi:uncharacterized iron-regulated membrane protein
MSAASESPAADGSTTVALYRLIFRLHFYAGLLVAPFVLVLAVTGIVYLFGAEIDDALRPGSRFVAATGEPLPVEQIVASAVAGYPGAIPIRVDLPTEPLRTAVVFLTPERGAPFRVYVDPTTGEARESFVYERTLVGFADVAHGTLMLGDSGDAIVELAACWAIVLVGTGLFLWWPRGARGLRGALVPRLRARGRAWWREVHAVVGVWTSLLVLFLLATGLPWSANWGRNLDRAMAAVGLGYPYAYRTHIGEHDATPSAQNVTTLADVAKGVPWTLEVAPAPHSHESHGAEPIDLRRAAQVFASAGLVTAYRLVLPRNEHDVFTAYTYPDRPQGQRTIHLDQYTGEIINDVSFVDYGVGAQAVELGVQIHMGNYFGLANQLLMAVAALGAALLALTGPVMWLKRRREGLGAPPPARAGTVTWAMAGGTVALGIVFPLLGLSLLSVLAVERWVLRRVPRVSDWLGLAPRPS